MSAVVERLDDNGSTGDRQLVVVCEACTAAYWPGKAELPTAASACPICGGVVMLALEDAGPW
jgi:hypothetical protein